MNGQDIAMLFAPGSPVAAVLGEQYRPRRGQAAMARLVKRALDEGQHALIEAGTGIGKSFAYLIPLIWSGQPAVVSTANKTLQNQLWEKDIPALRQISPRPFKAALLKGRSNYICRYKLEEQRPQLALPGQGLSIAEVWERLGSFPSGDVEEMRLFGELRSTLTADQHECLGRQCPQFGQCYYELAKIKAAEADIVVINHAMLALNMVLSSEIIAPRPVIVIDEAHELEGYMTNALRLQLEYEHIPAFINDTVVTRNVDGGVRGQAVNANHELFSILAQDGRGGNERRWLPPPELPQVQALMGHLNVIRRDLTRRYPPVPGGGEADEENARHKLAMNWAVELEDQIKILNQLPPEDQIRYCEQGPGKPSQANVLLCQEPLDISGFLHEHLWEAAQSVICTSATLMVNGNFAYLRKSLGGPAEGIIRACISSPFDYPKQALLYTPHDLCPQYEAGEEAYTQKLAGEVERLLRASRGRAFVLCTSARRARQLYEAIEPGLPYPCYLQGQASRNELLDLFRSGDGGVLFATKSFWEGVDVPGETLSLVIIDKLPFAPHRDPVIQHREQRIRQAGGSPFNDYMLPEAILALKQGVGRLIRTETDRGVMAILDSRLHTKQYGKQVIASLPNARQTDRFEDVAGFFAEK
jgi:Rad3-related DNA helicase